MTTRKRILVADASETIVAVCRKLLNEQGYNATLFQDGTKALEELKRSDYDLAVISTTTENVSGYFIIKELRKDQAKREMPVLLLLGSSELLDTKELVDCAPEDTLSKPFSPRDILTKIASLLSRNRPAGESAQEDDFDIESILSDDAMSLDSKIASTTDKIYLNMLKQAASESTTDKKNQLDKLDISEDQFSLEAAEPTRKSEPAAHDYDWFINEMSQDQRPKPPEIKSPASAPPSGKFQVEEFGTGKIGLEKLKQMKGENEAEKTKVYIDKLHEPFLGEVTSDWKDQPAEKITDSKSEFVRFLAEALAREIVKHVDFKKLMAKIDELYAVKHEK